ncbi:phage tail tape measure protein [Escherichia coli]|uniref:phage tail tape measure protein n=1 Tax=Escherichia coli TaxID=562 RepID=UPI00397FA0FA
MALIRQQAAEQNKVYQSIAGYERSAYGIQPSAGAGYELLQQRQGLVNVPLRLPQATLDDKQQSALTKTERELALSRLKGEEKSVSGWGMRRMTSVLWVIRIRRRDNVISVMPWKPGAITRR